MWFQVEENAPHDPRIRLLARRLGVSRGDAFLACCLVWCWLYKRGGDVMTVEEVDTVGEVLGLGIAMSEVGLADAVESGLRICGGKRAQKYADFRALQKKKALEREAAKRSNCMLENNGAPGVTPPDHQEGSMSLSSSGSGSSPDSGDPEATTPERVIALQRQSEKRLAARAATMSWVEWFNRRFARSYGVSQELVKQVGALLARGYSEKPDMRGVALYLQSRWEDSEEMRAFLRPSTILRPTKFAERLDEAREWAKSAAPDIWGAQ